PWAGRRRRAPAVPELAGCYFRRGGVAQHRSHDAAARCAASRAARHSSTPCTTFCFLAHPAARTTSSNAMTVVVFIRTLLQSFEEPQAAYPDRAVACSFRSEVRVPDPLIGK